MSVIHLDQGYLDLGIVRDSLHVENDFVIYGEVFENAALLPPAPVVSTWPEA